MTRFKVNWEDSPPEQQQNNESMMLEARGASPEPQIVSTSDLPSFNENSNSWATMECS